MLEFMPPGCIFRYSNIEGKPKETHTENFCKTVVSLAGFCFAFGFCVIADYPYRRKSYCHWRCLCGDVHIDYYHLSYFRNNYQAQGLVRGLPYGNFAREYRESKNKEIEIIDL